MTVSYSAMACPNLAGNYSCVGTGALAGKFQETITQTESYIQWGEANKIYFNKTSTANVDGIKIESKGSCHKNKFILIAKGIDVGQENFRGTSTVTKTAQGYDRYDIGDDGNITFETTAKCILQN